MKNILYTIAFLAFLAFFLWISVGGMIGDNFATSPETGGQFR